MKFVISGQLTILILVIIGFGYSIAIQLITVTELLTKIAGG